MQPIYLKRRCFIARFLRSYYGWRAVMGRWDSIKSAYKIAMS